MPRRGNHLLLVWALACAITGCGGVPELVPGRWVDLKQTGVLRNLAVTSDGTVFVASRPGVLRSRSRVTFEHMGPKRDIALVAVDLQDHVYAAIETYEQDGAYLAVSADVGNSWTDVSVAVSANGIAADPTAPGRVYLVGSNSQGDTGLYRSDDGGARFTRLSGLGGTLAVGSDGTLYLARHDGLWRSDDQGATLVLHATEPAGANLSPRFLLTDPGKPGHLILGTQDGLYTTWDSGATWSRTDPGVTASTCSVIYQNAARVPGSPNEIYMAVNAAGVYYSADNGATWQARNQGLPGDCFTPFGIGVVAGPEVVAYITHSATGGDSVFAYLAR